MNQNPNTGGCGCNDDYKNLYANAGMATITNSSTNLDGSGSTLVLSATGSGNNGTMVKSITIKAIMPVTDGMVRLFVYDGSSKYALYRELPIPTTPALANTPTPTPIMKTYEIALAGGLNLQSGQSLYASTQNAESFNVIAEGVNWGYQENLPPGCCNFKQETAVTGINTVSAANTMLDGSGTIITIFTAPTTTPANSGSVVNTLTVKAMQSTNPGMVRIFISPGGMTPTWYLFREICIPQTVQSGFDPSFKALLNENLHIPSGYLLGVTTQIGQSFALTVEGYSWVYPAY